MAVHHWQVPHLPAAAKRADSLLERCIRCSLRDGVVAAVCDLGFIQRERCVNAALGPSVAL